LRVSDKPIGALAKDLGISESCLRNWLAQADTDDRVVHVRQGSTVPRRLPYHVWCLAAEQHAT
jgi:transposase